MSVGMFGGGFRGKRVQDLLAAEGALAERREGEQSHDERYAAEDEVVDAQRREECHRDEYKTRKEIVLQIAAPESRFEKCGKREFRLYALEVGERAALFQPAVDGAHFHGGDVRLVILHYAVRAPVHGLSDDENTFAAEFLRLGDERVEVVEPQRVQLHGGEDDRVRYENVVASVFRAFTGGGAKQSDEIGRRAYRALHGEPVAGTRLARAALYVDRSHRRHQRRRARHGKHRRPRVERRRRPHEREQKSDHGESSEIHNARHAMIFAIRP